MSFTGKIALLAAGLISLACFNWAGGFKCNFSEVILVIASSFESSLTHPSGQRKMAVAPRSVEAGLPSQ